MTWVLVRKLLRDVRVAWLVVTILLFLFQILWARITMRVTTQILAAFARQNISPELIMQILLNQNEEGKSNEMLGQLVQAIIGGENIALDRAGDMMTVAYVHPLVMTILCIWAIGRAANAIAGEIDRGTMELLLAQPIRRSQVVLAHLCVDAIIFPALSPPSGSAPTAGRGGWVCKRRRIRASTSIRFAFCRHCLPSRDCSSRLAA